MGIFRKHIIGLEMDSKEIRAVEISGGIKNHYVSAWGRINLPDGSVREGKVANPDILSCHIEKLIKDNNFRDKNIILGVNNQDIIVRFATFPKVPEDKIRNMIQLQAEDYIPVPTAELELDYIITGETETEGKKYIHAILVGARKKMINDFIRSIENAGLRITNIDTTMLAIGRSALRCSDTGTFAAVGFNHDIGNIMIFREGILEFARTIPVSADIFEEKQAELQTDMIANILLNEMRSSVNYYLSQNSVEIEKIYVCGTENIQEAVASQISNVTGIEVVITDPYRYLKITGSNGTLNFNARNFTPCISLALRGLEE